MSTRSYSDVPNRIVNLFLQEAGERYDLARGLSPYRRMTDVLLARFDGACAYCGAVWEVEDHLVPRNRRMGGLHAWGNVVPCCRSCNHAKRDQPWEVHLAAVSPDAAASARAGDRINAYIRDYDYNPDTEALIPVLASLYDLADVQARGLVQFALSAMSHELGGLARATPDVVAAVSQAVKSEGDELN